MFAEAASPFGRLVTFMFSPILRFRQPALCRRGQVRSTTWVFGVKCSRLPRHRRTYKKPRRALVYAKLFRNFMAGTTGLEPAASAVTVLQATRAATSKR